MLLPVWRADVQSTIFDSEPYELIDRYLEAAIAKGGLGTETRWPSSTGWTRPCGQRGAVP